MANASPQLIAARPAANRNRAVGPTPTRRAGAPAAQPDSALLATLKQWRTTMAKGGKVPAYVIFADATLEAIATARPRRRADLLAVSGIGPVKVERYGEVLLQLIRDHESAGAPPA